jgi:PAS domain S-box-containing protein
MIERSPGEMDPCTAPALLFDANGVGQPADAAVAHSMADGDYAVAQLLDIPFPMWAARVDGALRWYNQRWLRLTGQTQVQQQADEWLATIHPDDRERCRAHWAQLLTMRQEATLEYRLRIADGTYRWMLETVAPSIDHDRIVAGFVGVCLDINDRHEREAALWRHVEHFRTLAEHANGMVSRHAPDGVYLYASEAAEHLIGYTPEELVGRWSYELVHPQDLPIVLRTHEALLAQTGAQSCAYRLLCKDGWYRWFETRWFAARDTTQAVVEIYAATRDITEQTQAEALLQTHAAHLRRAVYAAPLPVMIHADDGEVLLVNQVWTDLTGYTLHDLPTVADWSERAFGTRQPIGSDDIDQLYSLDRPLHEGEFVIRTQGGTLRSWDFHLVPIGPTHDGRRLVMRVALDVTDRRHAEREHAQLIAREQISRAEADVLREMDQLKSVFLANVSHDLRTPLHHIKGYASTLLRPHLAFDADTTQEYLRIVVDECDTLEQLISDLLDTSRLDSGKFALSIDSVDLGALARKAVARWQDVDDRRFTLEIPAELPPVPADGRRIQQVLDNLLTNIIHHTPPQTSATIAITTNRSEAIVSVVDNGPGISPEHLPRLFDRFYQAPSADRRSRGSGLGLFICKGIVEQHGGRIWVEMVPGAGTRFCFSLPRRYRNVRNVGTDAPAATH